MVRVDVIQSVLYDLVPCINLTLSTNVLIATV